MIDTKSYTIEWITNLRNKLGKRIDPKLIEKVIYALTLLEQLQLNNLNFVFKGGTALLLATEIPKRFSIDIDIITEEPEDKIKEVLEKISSVHYLFRIPILSHSYLRYYKLLRRRQLLVSCKISILLKLYMT